MIPDIWRLIDALGDELRQLLKVKVRSGTRLTCHI
jgi:hypothetical protein